MGDKSNIEWTDATWNPIVGCSIVSPGCTNCYAMKMAARIEAMSDGTHGAIVGARGIGRSHYTGTTQPSKAGPVWTGKLALAPKHAFTAPLRWKKPRTIFVNSMGDLFHEDCLDEWIDKVFAVMALAPQHTFQVLTKRAARMRAYFNGPYPNGDGVMARIADATFAFCSQGALPAGFPGVERGIGPNGVPEFGWRRFLNIGPLPNVWLGVSAEDQKRADERIPHLLETPAAVRFISAEPLLGPINLETIKDSPYSGVHALAGLWVGPDNEYRFCDCLDWVIVGGESGPNARPMHPDWARSLRDQCAAAGVPFFFKQWGEWGPCPDAVDWPYDPHYDRTTWFDAPTCVRPVEEGWSDKYHTGHCRAQDPFLLKPYGFSLFNTPEFLDQVKRCPQAKCGEAGKCLGNDQRQAVRYVGKKKAGRLLDGREHNDMPEVRR